MVFGAGEYAKDGPVPIVEITGKDSPWFDRMRGIVDDLFKHARPRLEPHRHGHRGPGHGAVLRQRPVISPF